MLIISLIFSLTAKKKSFTQGSQSFSCWKHLKKYSMKSYFKIILFFVFVFLLTGCGLNKYHFEKTNIYLLTNKKNENSFSKLDNIDFDDFFYKNVAVKFKSKSLKKYSFEICCSNEPNYFNSIFNTDTTYIKEFKIIKSTTYSCVNLNPLSNIVSYTYQKKLNDKYLYFSCTTNDSIDLSFLLQKFNEIQIIEK